MYQVAVTYTDGGRDVWDDTRFHVERDWVYLTKAGWTIAVIPRNVVRKVERIDS